MKLRNSWWLCAKSMQWPKIKRIHRKSELRDCERQQSKMLSSLPCLFILDQYLYRASSNSKLSFPIMNTKHSPLCPIRGGITHCLRTWKKDSRQTLYWGIQIVNLFTQMTSYRMNWKYGKGTCLLNNISSMLFWDTGSWFAF